MPERYLGRTLGRYRVEELIGTGGFAWVYRGFDPELEIPVAIKVLKPQFGGDPAFEERFRREASTAAKLRHPNIIKIYSVGRDGDAVYFVMDYLPSGLADKLEKTPSLPEEFVIHVGIDVARALGFAHREGVIHRDIKVDNIMFDVHGNAVVADFGIARAVSGYTQQTGTNMVVGTPQYFAPEQARAKPLDGRADIYSLGVSLYRAATGRLPFEGDDWYEIARQHVEEPPTPPRELNPALSPAFENVLLRCMAKHPDDRPSTGEELADELDAVLDLNRATSGAHARTVSVPPTQAPTVISFTARRKRRARRAATVAGIAVVALAAAAVPLLARLGDGRRGGAAGDSASVPVITGATVNPPADAGVVPPRADSQRQTTVPTRTDSAARAATNLARLGVTAPNDAQIFLNGVMVGEGRWRADTLAPGDYTVAAAIDAPEGCESARQEQEHRLRPGSQREIALAPRGCGTILLNGQPAGAHYTLVSADGTVKREGNLAEGTLPLLVPIGQYRFSAQKPQCATYDQDAALQVGQTVRIFFKMICVAP